MTKTLSCLKLSNELSHATGVLDEVLEDVSDEDENAEDDDSENDDSEYSE